MANIELPINPLLAKQSFYILLSKKRYKIIIRWNSRDEAFYIGLYTETSQPIFTNAKVLPGWILYRQYLSESKPPGYFAVVDMLTQNIPPTRYELGTDRRVRIVYIDTET